MNKGFKKQLFARTNIRKIISALCICSMALCLFSRMAPVKPVAADVGDTWLASTGFSNAQGDNQWYYIYRKVRGDFVAYNQTSETNRGTVVVTEQGSTPQDKWFIPYADYIDLTKNTQVASYGDGIARAWKAPETGKVFISGESFFTSGTGFANGVDYEIFMIPAADTSEKKLLWEESDYKDAAPLSHRFSVNVSEGDMIYFQVKTKDAGRTRVTWDPSITYIPAKNSAPAFPAIGEVTAKAGYGIAFSVEASDENFDILSYSSDNLPQGAQLNKKTGAVEWTPTEAQIGTYNVNFTVSDGEASDTATVKLTVAKIPLTKIEIASKPTKTDYMTGESFEIDGLVVTGTFSNGDKITFTDVTKDNISGFNSEIDSESTVIQTVTVTVNGLKATFPVNILYSPLKPHMMLRTITQGSNDVFEAEVNQEIFFTAEGSTYYGDTADDSSANASLMKIAQYQWDFGDGYKVSGNDNGIMATHFYMRPGTFTVTLTVLVYPSYNEGLPTGDLIAKRVISRKITISGDQPLEGYELLHAPFNARIAQFIKLDIPDDVLADSSNRLTVTLTGSNNTDLTLFNETNLSNEKKFLLEQRNLKAGQYTLTAILYDSRGNIITDGDRKGIWIETFIKDYDGIPKVGINEWNAICIDGEPTFPITTFMTNTEKFEGANAQFAGCMNSLYTIGWYPASPYHTVENYRDYLERAEANNLTVIGAGTGGAFGEGRSGRNRSTIGIHTLATMAAQSNALLMHTWKDEPNLGGRNVSVYLPTLRAWKYATEEVDRQHPTALNMYGYDYLPFTSKGTEYFYVNSTKYNDRHTFYADVLTADVYPMVIRKHATLKNRDRGVIDMYVQSIDNKIETSMGLVPTGMFNEVCNDWKYEAINGKVPDPSNSQVLMEAWLATIHGVKMINWFPFFTYSTIRYDAMREFTTAMKTYEKIILSRDDVEQVTDDSNVRTNRVDTLTRMNGNDTYLFTARLTEPDPIEGEDKHLAYPEPETITTTFTVPDKSSKTAYVQDETGKVIRQIPITDGRFTDTFGKDECRIYKITSDKTDIVPGDVDGNGEVDIRDLAMVAKDFDKSSTSTDWSKVRSADVNKDNIINITDIAFIARKM